MSVTAYRAPVKAILNVFSYRRVLRLATRCTEFLHNSGMREYTASEARERFAEILQSVEQGEEVAITRHGKPIARIIRVKNQRISAPGWGAKEGWSIAMSQDFDCIPDDFEGYI